MNYEADELLDMVDKWKFSLYDKLKKLPPGKRSAFWQESAGRASEMGFQIVQPQTLRSMDKEAS